MKTTTAYYIVTSLYDVLNDVLVALARRPISLRYGTEGYSTMQQDAWLVARRTGLPLDGRTL